MDQMDGRIGLPAGACRTSAGAGKWAPHLWSWPDELGAASLWWWRCWPGRATGPPTITSATCCHWRRVRRTATAPPICSPWLLPDPSTQSSIFNNKSRSMRLTNSTPCHCRLSFVWVSFLSVWLDYRTTNHIVESSKNIPEIERIPSNLIFDNESRISDDPRPSFENNGKETSGTAQKNVVVTMAVKSSPWSETSQDCENATTTTTTTTIIKKNK